MSFLVMEKPVLLLVAILGVFLPVCSAWFLEEFDVTWTPDHVKRQMDNNTIQLILDQGSGAGIKSKHQYMFGLISVKIKLVANDSAGTVTTFYLCSSNETVRDELDFEFLGNRSGQPYTVQTNVFAKGEGGREQRVNLWFDPSLDFHKYSILWNHNHIIFLVDEVPIRVYKNNEARGVPFPKKQSMEIISTLWNADNWATRGGLEKIDWTKAPFTVSYKDLDIQSCEVPRNSTCTIDTNNWWESASYSRLSPLQTRLYRWVRVNHMVYDYCSDKSRYPVPPPECNAGI